MRRRLWAASLALSVLASPAFAADAPAAMDKAALEKLVKVIDERQQNPSDFRSIAYIDRGNTKEKPSPTTLRDQHGPAGSGQRNIFSRPKSVGGLGIEKLTDFQSAAAGRFRQPACHRLTWG